ncbi:unnamed protein product, partial [Meganyctiphanes norvegica]
MLFRTSLRTLYAALIIALWTGVAICYDDYYEDYYDDKNIEAPIFTTRPQSFTVVIGQSVVIPCDAQNQGGYKLVIKKALSSGGEQLLWVGREKMARTKRLILDPATLQLTITHIRSSDAGTYVCHFPTIPPVEVRHHLDVQFPPVVSLVVPSEQRVREGSRVNLVCEAMGNPKPVVRWTMQQGSLAHLPRHQQRLEIPAASRKDTGTYLCTADNGIGHPVSITAKLIVEYPPEITAEQTSIISGSGGHVELVCTVSGQPVPQVIWTHDGRVIQDSRTQTSYTAYQGRVIQSSVTEVSSTTHSDKIIQNTQMYPSTMDTSKLVQATRMKVLLTTESTIPILRNPQTYNQGNKNFSNSKNVTVQKRATFPSVPNDMSSPDATPIIGYRMDTSDSRRHILTLKDVQEADFGAYVCIADNHQGKASATIQITGLPQPPRLTSVPESDEYNSYSFTWESESYYPISDLMLKYRPKLNNITAVVTGSWERVTKHVEQQSAAPQGLLADQGYTRDHSQTYYQQDYLIPGGNSDSSWGPAVESGHPDHELMRRLQLTVPGLTPGVDYVGSVKVRNHYGWSMESPHFTFSTKKGRPMAIHHQTNGSLRHKGCSFIFFTLSLNIFVTD